MNHGDWVLSAGWAPRCKQDLEIGWEPAGKAQGLPERGSSSCLITHAKLPTLQPEVSKKRLGVMSCFALPISFYPRPHAFLLINKTIPSNPHQVRWDSSVQVHSESFGSAPGRRQKDEGMLSWLPSRQQGRGRGLWVSTATAGQGWGEGEEGTARKGSCWRQWSYCVSQEPCTNVPIWAFHLRFHRQVTASFVLTWDFQLAGNILDFCRLFLSQAGCWKDLWEEGKGNGLISLIFFPTGILLEHPLPTHFFPQKRFAKVFQSFCQAGI